MSVAREIPLKPINQQFTISLAGVQYTARVYWSQAALCWVADLLDATGENAILCGVALVTGADLLAQFAYLALGGELIVQTDHDTDAVPTFANLGSTGHLYFVTPT